MEGTWWKRLTCKWELMVRERVRYVRASCAEFMQGSCEGGSSYRKRKCEGSARDGEGAKSLRI